MFVGLADEAFAELLNARATGFMEACLTERDWHLLDRKGTLIGGGWGFKSETKADGWREGTDSVNSPDLNEPDSSVTICWVTGRTLLWWVNQAGRWPAAAAPSHLLTNGEEKGATLLQSSHCRLLLMLLDAMLCRQTSCMISLSGYKM